MTKISSGARVASRGRDAIEALARETHFPIDEVERVFAVEFARLQREARVADYLVLFASRRARENLLTRSS